MVSTTAILLVVVVFVAAMAVIAAVVIRVRSAPLRAWRAEGDRVATAIDGRIDTGWSAMAVTDGKVWIVWTGRGDTQVTRIMRCGKTEELRGWATGDAVVEHLRRPCSPEKSTEKAAT